MTGSEKNLEQLLHDDGFIRWVTSPDESSDEYWRAWQEENYSRKDLVVEARQLVLSIYQKEEDNAALYDKAVIAQAWQEINNQTQSTIFDGGRIVNKTVWFKYAAIFLVIAATAIFWLQYRSPDLEDTKTNGSAAFKNLATTEAEFKNNEDKDVVINLVDGSRITLSKNSSVRYQRLLNDKKREVYLKGEAFFEIAKDTARPFYVYSGNVVTKVLGTSFRILSDSSRGKVTVAVKTGKVTVFRQDQTEGKDDYVLAPHEQVVFENITAIPSKQMITDPALLEYKLPAARHFDFEEAPMATILETLSKFYSVEIAYNQPGAQQCLVTVSLAAGSLYDKLDFLNKVAGATWFIKDQRIYVDGKECK